MKAIRHTLAMPCIVLYMVAHGLAGILASFIETLTAE